ncbi:MAG: VOC family protein [Candidatus Lokiarchaeota archaeon]|nr:VOC family protein [Candidatus Lokiarchaeota archaeon]
MKIDHIAIWVRDLEKIRIFYETYFGAKSNDKYFNSTHEFSSNFLTFDGGTRLELMQMPSIPESSNNPYKQFTGFIHLAISVGSKEKVIALTTRLANDGYEVLVDPRYTGDGYFESTILDPEKNRIEITV